MRSVSFKLAFALAVLFSRAAAQTNPHTQIHWPSGCNAANMVYNVLINGCVNVTGVAANPSGSDTQVQFNLSGSFGADANFTWDHVNHILGLGPGNDQPTGHQAATANAAVTTFSVLEFGAKHDRVLLPANNCTNSNGSPNLSCPGAAFTQADVGKSVGILSDHQVFNSSTSPQLGQVATILTVTDATHIVLSKSSVKSTGGLTVEYGTDNAPPFNSCVLAVLASQGGIGTCKIPAGPYLLASAPNSMLWGAYDDGSYGQPAGGSGAVLTAVLGTGGTAGQIASVTVTSGGSGYTPNASLQTSINNPTNQPTSGCQTYGNGNMPRNNGPCGWAYVLATTNGSGVVTGTTVVYPGYGFTSVPSITVIPLGGDGATATVTVTAGSANSPSITAGGGGYPASVSNIPMYMINGTGCAAINPQTSNLNSSGANITAVGTATTNSSGAIVSGAWTNAGSGCSAAGTVIFGSAACWDSGTSRFDQQCANVTPLNPVQVPVQVALAQGVSWEGGAAEASPALPGAQLFGVWDFSTADNNQPVMFGGDQYLGQYSVNGLSFQQGFVGMAVSFSVAAGSLSHNLFSNGIGFYAAGEDNGADIHDNECFGYACMVEGGIWASRVDGPSVSGGYANNNIPQRNLFYSATPYQSSSGAANVDLWFANNFFHPEYTANATDFAQTCTFPESANQRQTSHSISSSGYNGGGNALCYPGVTNWGHILMPKQHPTGNDHSIYSLTVVGNSRGLDFDDLGTKGQLLDGVCCEGGTQITSDPFRTDATLRGCIITLGMGLISDTSCFISSGSILQTLFSPAGTNGAPLGSWHNVTCGNGCTNGSPPTASDFMLDPTIYAGASTFSSPVTNTVAGASAQSFSGFPNASHALINGSCTGCATYFAATPNSSSQGGAFIFHNPGNLNQNADFLDHHSYTGSSSPPSTFTVDHTGAITKAASITLNGITMSTGVITISASITPAAATVSTCTEQTGFTFTGVATSQNALSITPPSTLGAHLWIPANGLRISAANTLAITFCADATGGTPPAGTYKLTVF